MIPFNFHHLYYFYNAAKKRSFSEAARSLYISQPAFSLQLKQFENYWGFPLFERRGKKISLTEEGQILLHYAESIFDLGDEAAGALANRKAGELNLRVGVSSAVPKAIAAAFMRHVFDAGFPVKLTVRQDSIENMAADLMGHKLDMILNDFAYQSAFEDKIHNQLVAKIPMVFCAGRALARKYRNLPSDLDGADLILPTAADQTYHAMQRYVQEHNIRPKIAAEVQDLELARTLIAEGRGVGLLNYYSVLHSPDSKDIAVLKDSSGFLLEDTIYLITKERKLPHPFFNKIAREFRLASPVPPGQKKKKSR